MFIRGLQFSLLILSNNLFCQVINPELQYFVDKTKVEVVSNVLSLKSGYHEVQIKITDNNCTSILYKISSHEKSWNFSNYPEIRYTNLPGGNYFLDIECLNNVETRWQKKVQIEVNENIWEKWWFWFFIIALAAFVVFLIVYFWVLYDNRQKAKVQSIRRKIAADLHDEVGANLSSITFFVESLKRMLTPKQDNIFGILDKISANSMESASLINDTIWALNPNYDSFEKLLFRIKSFGNSIFSSQDVQFEIINHLEETDRELNIEQRRNLYLILKEALNNAAKHAKAQKVSIEVSENKEYLIVQINDNGIGFKVDGESNGNGLLNFVNRQIDDVLIVSVHSIINEGTQIEVKLRK